MNYVNLSKSMSYALRHKPEEFGLTLDTEGYVLMDDLCKAMKCSKEDVEHLVNTEQNKDGAKKRFEISGDYVRACYGHSTKQVKIEYEESVPPKVMYHGTRLSVAERIEREGLKPMHRQYVHLSEDEKTANIVANRWHTETVLFEVDTESAYKDGARFYKGNDTTWLCDYVNPKYLKRMR